MEIYAIGKKFWRTLFDGTRMLLKKNALTINAKRNTFI